RLVEADHPLLDEVVAVPTGEEVRTRLEADEAGVAAHEVVEGLLAPVPRLEDELEILELSLDLLGRLRWSGGANGHAWYPHVDGALATPVRGDHAVPRASLTLKLRENLAPFGARYKRFARYAEC